MEFLDIVFAESKNTENSNSGNSIFFFLNIIFISIFLFFIFYLLYKWFSGNFSQFFDFKGTNNNIDNNVKKIIINREHLKFLQKIVDKKIKEEEEANPNKKKEFSPYEEYYKETSKFYSEPEDKNDKSK